MFACICDISSLLVQKYIYCLSYWWLASRLCSRRRRRHRRIVIVWVWDILLRTTICPQFPQKKKYYRPRDTFDWLIFVVWFFLLFCCWLLLLVVEIIKWRSLCYSVAGLNHGFIDPNEMKMKLWKKSKSRTTRNAI